MWGHIKVFIVEEGKLYLRKLLSNKLHKLAEMSLIEVLSLALEPCKGQANIYEARSQLWPEVCSSVPSNQRIKLVYCAYQFLTLFHHQIFFCDGIDSTVCTFIYC